MLCKNKKLKNILKNDKIVFEKYNKQVCKTLCTSSCFDNEDYEFVFDRLNRIVKPRGNTHNQKRLNYQKKFYNILKVEL